MRWPLHGRSTRQSRARARHEGAPVDAWQVLCGRNEDEGEQATCACPSCMAGPRAFVWRQVAADTHLETTRSNMVSLRISVEDLFNELGKLSINMSLAD